MIRDEDDSTLFNILFLTLFGGLDTIKQICLGLWCSLLAGFIEYGR